MARLTAPCCYVLVVTLVLKPSEHQRRQALIDALCVNWVGEAPLIVLMSELKLVCSQDAN